MKTNNKLHPVFSYLMECIDFNGSNSEKLHSVLIVFNSDFNFDQNKRRYPNHKDRFSEWLQGLPSCFTIAFYNSEILELAEKWGSLPINATSEQKDKILANYWNFMSCKFFQLCKQNKVDYSYTY